MWLHKNDASKGDEGETKENSEERYDEVLFESNNKMTDDEESTYNVQESHSD